MLAASAPALLAAGCQAAASPSAPAAPVVDVAMSEYEFDYDPDPPAGRVVIRARNLGRLSHELVLVSLPEDLPPIAEQLRSDERRSAASVARIPPRDSGATGTFAVDLAPGRYAFVCFVVGADGQQYARKGMASEFRVI